MDASSLNDSGLNILRASPSRPSLEKALGRGVSEVSPWSLEELDVDVRCGAKVWLGGVEERAPRLLEPNR